MTLQELHQLAALGEGASLEFKRRVPRPERIAKELIAFANTDGGRLLLGVDDDGTVMGVDDAAEEEFVLQQAVQNYCRPEVEYTTERVITAARRDVIVVSVPESPAKPHRLRNGSDADGTAYVRVNEMSVEASDEAVALMQNGTGSSQRVRVQFGEEESLLMRYLNDYGRITVEQFAQLANIPLARASKTLVSMTKANVLRLHTDRKEDYFTLAY